MDAISPDWFDECRVVAERPVKGLVKHLIGVGIEPVVVQTLGQRRHHLLVVVRLRRTNVDGEARGVCRVHKGRELVDMREDFVVLGGSFFWASTKEVVGTQGVVLGAPCVNRHHAFLHDIDVEHLSL